MVTVNSVDSQNPLFELAPIPYQCLDGDGNILMVNQAWLDELRYERDEVMGKWFGDFVNPNQRQLFKDRFLEFKSRGWVRGVEFEMLCKDGSKRLVSYEGKVIFDKQGNFLNTQCMFVDITKRVEMEIDLETKIGELRRINKLMIDRELRMLELKKRIEELETINRSKT